MSDARSTIRCKLFGHKIEIRDHLTQGWGKLHPGWYIGGAWDLRCARKGCGWTGRYFGSLSYGIRGSFDE